MNEKTDCFAYRPCKSKYQSCSALTICYCWECPFYKTYADNEREQAETKIRAKRLGYYRSGFYEPKRK